MSSSLKLLVEMILLVAVSSMLTIFVVLLGIVGEMDKWYQIFKKRGRDDE